MVNIIVLIITYIKSYLIHKFIKKKGFGLANKMTMSILNI